MAITLGISIDNALKTMPAGTNKTNFTADLNQILTDLNTAVTAGSISASIAASLFEDLLESFGFELSNNLAS